MRGARGAGGGGGGASPERLAELPTGRLSSPETNLKVGRLPLFFMQLLLSHMFLSFTVRTSPLSAAFIHDFMTAVMIQIHTLKLFSLRTKVPHPAEKSALRRRYVLRFSCCLLVP